MESLDREFLKELTDTNGLPGLEDEVRTLIHDKVSSYADEVETDWLGNLYMTKGKGNRGPHLAFAAHMDEVGLMVDRVDEDGYIKLTPLGGIDPRVLLAKRVTVGKERIPGVIGSVPPFLVDAMDSKKVIGIKDLRLDIGASSKAQAQSLVSPGDPVAFDTNFEARDGIIKGKAFDDRLGCYILAELIREDYDVPVTFIWTVQEEVGLRGARIASARVKPDILIVVEGTGAGDVPVDKDTSRLPRIGKGPVITILDGSVVASRRLMDFITNTADACGLPWQYKRPLVGGTDAGAAVRVKSLDAAVVAVPSRYIHSPVAISSTDDIINAIKLVKKVTHDLKRRYIER
ncbi:M42 family metallopeptidase [bacterium]|nr:M42 family metallopeptidase [bacterium]